MLCAKIVPIVNGLEKEFAGKLAFDVVGVDEGDSQQRIDRYGLDIHGMVITDDQDQVVWAESGHKQTAAGVRAAIEQALGG